MSRFHSVDRQTGYLLPPSVGEWLPEDHLARFIVEVVDGLDISNLEKAYAGRGSTAYHPSVLLSLLVYGYANGVFSSRNPGAGDGAGNEAPETWHHQSGRYQGQSECLAPQRPVTWSH